MDFEDLLDKLLAMKLASAVYDWLADRFEGVSGAKKKILTVLGYAVTITIFAAFFLLWNVSLYAFFAPIVIWVLVEIIYVAYNYFKEP